MMVMGYAITLRSKKRCAGCIQPWTNWQFLCFAGVATLFFGCAEVNHPADPPAAIPDPSLISSVDSPHPVAPPYSLAILPFEDYSNRSDLSWLRQGLPDMLVTDLALLPGVRVVSRHRLGEVLREQWLQHRGSFEEASSVRLGRLVGARYLLSGLYHVGGENLILEVHILDVEQGSVVRTFRVTGAAQAIPDLELDLASQLGRVFDASALSSTGELESPPFGEQESPKLQLDPHTLDDLSKEIESQKTLPEEVDPLTTTLRTDTVLGLERLRHVRDAAASMAHDIWAQALSVHMGALQYGSSSGEGGSARALTVSIPLSATIREESIRRLDSGLRIVDSSGGIGGSEIVLNYEESDAGAQQLFRESIQAPRRLFVRAIRESGEVVGVSSEWSWRMDLHVHARPDGTISLPSSSSPFLKGHATFGSALLTGHDSGITFDTVVVPVPDESRSISVEVVDAQPEEETSLSTTHELVTSLQSWLLHRWVPPVAETIPVSGYLPGNRRDGIALVSGKGGTVSSFQIIHVDEEEKFAESVKDVLNKLPGKCFQECVNPAPKKVLPKSFTLRVQFELTKDIRHAGLGRPF